MITPLEIENKIFSRQMRKGYNTDEVDDFLDDLTKDYETLYKENIESKQTISKLEEDMKHYKSIETTLQSTLVMAQSTAEEVKNVAKQQAEQIINDAQINARKAVDNLETEITLKTRQLEDIKKQFDIYKAKMESLLISQLELLKDIKDD